MDDRKKERTEFDLEDILKEFADEPRETSEQPWEDEDILIWEGVMPESFPQDPAMPQDTVRLDEITKAVRQQEESPLEQTIAFTPVGGEEEEQEPVIIAPEEPPVEPYSEEWDGKELPIVTFDPEDESGRRRDQ